MIMAGMCVCLLIGLMTGCHTQTIPVSDSASQKRLLCFEMTLTNGLTVIGTPRNTSLTLKTSFAKINVPLAKIARIDVIHADGTAALEMRNGDRLTAGNLRSFRVRTATGDVSIAIGDIDCIKVRQVAHFPRALPPKPFADASIEAAVKEALP